MDPTMEATEQEETVEQYEPGKCYSASRCTACYSLTIAAQLDTLGRCAPCHEAAVLVASLEPPRRQAYHSAPSHKDLKTGRKRFVAEAVVVVICLAAIWWIIFKAVTG